MNLTFNIVNLVLWFLAFLSLLIWTIAIAKFFSLSRNKQGNQKFLQAFYGANKLGQLDSIAKISNGSLARLGGVAIEEIRSFASIPDLSQENRREMLVHVMRQQAHEEQAKLENGLAVLASVGSTAPFIGLFGTVWGIMHALKNISATGSAGLDVVAGPIGEALIATAIGIATAVPAVLAYNYYLRKIKLAMAEMENFASAFLQFITKNNKRA